MGIRPQADNPQELLRQAAERVRRAGFACHIETPYCRATMQKFGCCGNRKTGHECESYYGCKKVMEIINSAAWLMKQEVEEDNLLAQMRLEQAFEESVNKILSKRR